MPWNQRMPLASFRHGPLSAWLPIVLAALALSGWFNPPEAEQRESEETRIAGALVQQRRGFVIVLMRALSAWPR